MFLNDKLTCRIFAVPYILTDIPCLFGRANFIEPEIMMGVIEIDTVLVCDAMISIRLSMWLWGNDGTAPMAITYFLTIWPIENTVVVNVTSADPEICGIFCKQNLINYEIKVSVAIWQLYTSILPGFVF